MIDTVVGSFFALNAVITVAVKSSSCVCGGSTYYRFPTTGTNVPTKNYFFVVFFCSATFRQSE